MIADRLFRWINGKKNTSIVLSTREYTTGELIGKLGYDLALILFKLLRKINGICLQVRFTIPK